MRYNIDQSLTVNDMNYYCKEPINSFEGHLQRGSINGITTD